MSKNKNPLSYTSFPRIAIIKGTGIRDKKHTSQKNKNLRKLFI
jgi:mevalonate pyrophosphate decarboxylase